jgi:hypothetical protein
MLWYRSRSCYPLCHGLHVPACKETLPAHQGYCTEQAKEAVCGRCCAAQHTCYCIAASPVIRSATAFMCLHVSKRYHSTKHIVLDRQKKQSVDGAGLQNTPVTLSMPVLLSTLPLRPSCACMQATVIVTSSTLWWTGNGCHVGSFAPCKAQKNQHGHSLGPESVPTIVLFATDGCVLFSLNLESRQWATSAGRSVRAHLRGYPPRQRHHSAQTTYHKTSFCL